MKNIWKYLLLFFGVFLVVFCVALPLFGLGMMRTGGLGFNRAFGLPGGIGRMPMMNGFGGFGILNIVFMLFRIGIPLALLALAIVGVIYLVRRSSTAPITPISPIAAVTEPCPNCARAVQKDWSVCPYCGERLVQTAPPPPPEENAGTPAV